MSTNLDPILNKVTNENIEINCRAISNLLTKLNNNLISLEFMDDITGYKFLFSLTKLFRKHLSFHILQDLIHHNSMFQRILNRLRYYILNVCQET